MTPQLLCILFFFLGSIGMVFGFYQWLLRRDAESNVERLRHLASYNHKERNNAGKV